MSTHHSAPLRIGARVVVRHLIEGGARATDTLGELVAATDTDLLVRGRHGDVSIARADVVAAKAVPPRPWRLEAFLRRAGVAVLDLDGVLRDFDVHGHRTQAEREMGLTEFGLLDIAFGLPEASAMVIGRDTRGGWVRALHARMVELGHPQEAARRAVDHWVSDRGTPIAATARLVDELRAQGRPVFVFTNGTDEVPAELEEIGLGHLVPGLLNTHDLGFAKPAPEAYAVAHAEIERRLGRMVGRAEVRFTDDRVDNVDAAREFGWQAQVFLPPP